LAMRKGLGRGGRQRRRQRGRRRRAGRARTRRRPSCAPRPGAPRAQFSLGGVRSGTGAHAAPSEWRARVGGRAGGGARGGPAVVGSPQQNSLSLAQLSLAVVGRLLQPSPRSLPRHAAARGAGLAPDQCPSAQCSGVGRAGGGAEKRGLSLSQVLLASASVLLLPPRSPHLALHLLAARVDALVELGGAGTDDALRDGHGCLCWWCFEDEDEGF
jgi:hypothetical protein